MSANCDACGQGGGTRAPSPPRHSPVALSTGREVEPIKPVSLVHAEAVRAGPQRVVAHIPQIHRQLGAQAGLGGQAQDVFQPRPVVTCGEWGAQAQACPVFSTRPRGPGCTAFLPLPSLQSPLCTPAGTSQNPAASPRPSLDSESPSNHCLCACHRTWGGVGTSAPPVLAVPGGSEGPAPLQSRGEGCPLSPKHSLYV